MGRILLCAVRKKCIRSYYLRSYNYAMRMGNRSHTLVMNPQIWNLMLSAGLR